MPSIKISTQDKAELLRLLLGVIGVGALTALLFNRAELYLAGCELIAQTTCEYSKHPYSPTWERSMLGMLILVISVSSYATFTILRRSINRPEGDVDKEERAPEIKGDKELSTPTVQARPKASVAPHTTLSLETASPAPPSHPSTAHGSPVYQSTGPNVEVVSVEKGKQQLKALKKKEG